MWKSNVPRLLLVALFCLILSSACSIFEQESAGSECKVSGEKIDIQGEPHICAKGKINSLRWIPILNTNDSEKALGLAFAGCTQGSFRGFQTKRIYWYPRLYFGSIISFAYSTDAFERNPVWDLDVYKSSYITETFSSAATFDDTWSDLSNYWNKSVENSIETWKRGGVDGLEAIGASRTFDSEILGVCRVALNKVKAKAKDSMRSQEQWVEAVTKGLLPLPFAR